MTVDDSHFRTRIDAVRGAALVDALTIYADWLEERGDDRADGIRYLAEHKKRPINQDKLWWFTSRDQEPNPLNWFYELRAVLFGRHLTISEETKSAAYIVAASAFVKQRELNRDAANAATCPCCKRKSTDVSRRRQQTAYVDDSLNWLTSCLECWELADEYWQERWEDYYSSR